MRADKGYRKVRNRTRPLKKGKQLIIGGRKVSTWARIGGKGYTRWGSKTT